MLVRSIMAGLAEFERDLIRDRVKSGLAAARARGVKLGRQHGQRPSDKKAKRVLAMHTEGPVLLADWPQCRTCQKTPSCRSYGA
jgi:DNA invertase Pin-like site-specific DNA recombinase